MNLIKYILTSPNFEGRLIFGFDGDKLRLYSDESNLTRSQLEWMMLKRPFTEQELKEFVRHLKVGAKLTMVPPSLEFDAFWNAYKKKVNRQRCEPLWKKMSDAERTSCLMSIAAYDSFLMRDGRAKLDPENYLKRKAWDNNWNAL
jgi:hypothetical protein